MATRPTTIPQLDTTKTNRTIPAGSKVTAGYSTNDLLPASNVNYLHGWAGDWLEWLQERSEDGTFPGIDLTLRGLDALTSTTSGGSVTLKGGDRGATSGAGGDVICLPGSAASVNPGRFGVGTADPAYPFHFSVGLAADLAVDTTDPTTRAELRLESDDSGTVKGSWRLGTLGSSSAGVAGRFYLIQDKDTTGASVGLRRLTVEPSGEVVIGTDLAIEGRKILFGDTTSDDYLEHDDTANDLGLWLDGNEEWTFSQYDLDCHSNNVLNANQVTALTMTATSTSAAAYAVYGIVGSAGTGGVKGDGGSNGTGAEGVLGLADSAANAVGVRGIGYNAGYGVKGEAWSGSNAVGVWAVGLGIGHGVLATSGTSGDAINATASGGGYGLRAIGGTTSPAAIIGEAHVSSSSIGIKALAHGTGYGAWIEADTTTPTRSALRIVPQDTEPSTALMGDIWVDSSGVLWIYTTTWTKVGTQT